MAGMMSLNTVGSVGSLMWGETKQDRRGEIKWHNTALWGLLAPKDGGVGASLVNPNAPFQNLAARDCH